MTYSQRSTSASAASDISYLEYQIKATQEEIDQTKSVAEGYESMLNALQTSPGYDPEVHSEEEGHLLELLAGKQAWIDAANKRITELETELDKLDE
ncbi:hypothetical protein [Paenibacillus monticola]|uniref:Uncharacterized protein n=1 Tax=Paenibacillus monticola TaxID=2666075 RepID=A0A7X2H147_9BACL|nr:hypothetical protein [Paenibacillus monticola]MRN51620.1 hypothetical protein [Paenibacillus monticola]